MCCKDSTIFSLSPHLCVTDFPDKEHSLFLPLLFGHLSPPSSVAARPYRMPTSRFSPTPRLRSASYGQLSSKTRQVLRKSPPLFRKTPQLFSPRCALFFSPSTRKKKTRHLSLGLFLFFAVQSLWQNRFLNVASQNSYMEKTAYPLFPSNLVSNSSEMTHAYYLFCRNRAYSHFFSSPIPIFGNEISYRPQKNKS